MPLTNVKRRARRVTRGTLSAILQLRCAGRACTIDAAEDLSVPFDPMADDTAIALRTNGREGVDRAFEAIKDVALSSHDDFKGLVIIVIADFAFSHTQFVRARGGSRRCRISCRAKIPVCLWPHRCR